jgi:acyl-CoA dehydrogenase
MYDTSNDSKMLLDTVQKFLIDEIYPHEDRVDKLGYVPDEIGKQIEEKSKEAGLFAANLPEKYGGGGLDYSSLMVVEREYGKTSHALHSWIARPTEILLACNEKQMDEYLYPCVKGDKRELFALTEPDAGSDIMSMKSNAKKRWSGLDLKWFKTFYFWAMYARFCNCFRSYWRR